EIETRELLAREIGRLKGCRGSDGSLDVCARHFRRCHLRRRQIDVLHHILRGCGNGGGKTEHRHCTDPDRRAYHRLALPRRLPPLSGRCSDDKTAERIIAHGYRRDHLDDRLLATSREARADGSRWAVFDRALCAAAPRVHTLPWPWLENCRNRAGCDDTCGVSCEPPKHLRVGEEWAGTDFFEQTVLRARNSTPHAR